MPRKIIAAPLEPMETIEEKWVLKHGETFKNCTEADNSPAYQKNSRSSCRQGLHPDDAAQ